MADVVHERGDDECRGILLVDRGCEPRLVAEPGKKLEREPVDAERMLEPRMGRARVDGGDEPELADPGEPPQRGRVDQRPDSRRDGHGHARRDADAIGTPVEGHEFGQLGEGHGAGPREDRGRNADTVQIGVKPAAQRNRAVKST